MVAVVPRAVVVVVLLVAATPGCREAAPPAPPPFALEPCGGVVVPDPAMVQPRRGQLTYACGTLSVPVDHDDPDGERLGIEVVRVRSSVQHDRLGSLVVNFGGPGESGVERMAQWPGAVSDALLERFDLVSFDPRGVGRSEGIRCDDDDEITRPDNDLLTDEGFEAQAASSRAFVAACLASLGDLAPAFSTDATARDLDLLRAALGDERLTYVGYSYGAKLGAEYARRFPTSVRALVLDAPSDPAQDPVAVHERQVAGFEGSFAAYAAGCSKRPTCRELGEDPTETLLALVDAAGREPIPTGEPGDDRTAQPSDLLFGAASFLYSDTAWPELDEALRAARDDADSTAFFEIRDAFVAAPDDPELADPQEAAYVINCNDTAAGVPSDDQVRAALRRLATTHRVFGRWGGFGLFMCQYWQPERHALPVPAAPAAPPVVVVDTVGDPATPYAGAVAMAAALGSGRLLTWEGAGHTAHTRSSCIDARVDAYLIDLEVPPEGTRCPV